jgi:hypothetical protein
MNIGNLRTAASKLRDAHEMLTLRWEETRRHWNDGNSRSLEENYLEPLASDVKTTLQAAMQLSDVLMRAQRECES